MTLLTAKIQKALNKLTAHRHRNPREIASYLKQRGIKGFAGHPSKCPVTQFIKQEVDDAVVLKLFQIGTTRRYVMVNTAPRVRIPKQLRTFIKRFDAGKYPALIWHSCHIPVGS